MTPLDGRQHFVVVARVSGAEPGGLARWAITAVDEPDAERSWVIT
jgi:hypothetical protein